VIQKKFQKLVMVGRTPKRAGQERALQGETNHLATGDSNQQRPRKGGRLSHRSQRVRGIKEKRMNKREAPSCRFGKKHGRRSQLEPKVELDVWEGRKRAALAGGVAKK